MKKQFFSDFYGNTASITDTGTAFVLICRNCYGNVWKRKEYTTAKDAKFALTRTGDSWHTTKWHVNERNV